jgi:NAD(P)-dependent dehydrogenase (short-subunit alcohol dehydrogenase family)
MQGKTVVITGATSGIGEVAAIRLAEKGARIVFTARDKGRADETMGKLKRANPNVDHALHMADLSRLAEMKRIGAELAREHRIDVLVNNAGALFNKRLETEDGLEMTFALNHMAYFVITNTLSSRLKTGVRIVTVASNAHRGARLDFTCSRGAAMRAFRSIPNPSSATSCSTVNWRGASQGRASPPMPCIRALSPPASATIAAGSCAPC